MGGYKGEGMERDSTRVLIEEENKKKERKGKNMVLEKGERKAE